MHERKDLYPGYDVLAKRDTPSWNAQTREVIDRRLALADAPHRFFTDAEWRVLQAMADRLVPQPAGRPDPVPLAAMVDAKMQADIGDGHRIAGMPRIREAWRRGLAALDCEAHAGHGAAFPDLPGEAQDGLLRAMQEGRLVGEAWGGMKSDIFFGQRVIADLIKAYYAHPTAWSEIGFGGPASPRGYVRMDYNRRDPWEAAEAKPGHEDEAARENARVGR